MRGQTTVNVDYNVPFLVTRKYISCDTKVHFLCCVKKHLVLDNLLFGVAEERS